MIAGISIIAFNSLLVALLGIFPSLGPLIGRASVQTIVQSDTIHFEGDEYRDHKLRTGRVVYKKTFVSAPALEFPDTAGMSPSFRVTKQTKDGFEYQLAYALGSRVAWRATGPSTHGTD